MTDRPDPRSPEERSEWPRRVGVVFEEIGELARDALEYECGCVMAPPAEHLDPVPLSLCPEHAGMLER